MPARQPIAQELVEALSSGTTLVTGNARLARELHHRFDLEQRARGLTLWETPSILSWNAWLARLWEQFPAPLLLSQAQESFLWERIIRESEDGKQLLHPPAAAASARRSYALCEAWHVQRTPAAFEGFDDARAFARWARDFDTVLRENRWISSAHLPRELESRATSGRLQLPSRLLWAGMIEIEPAQRGLLDAIAAAGCAVAEAPLAAPGVQSRRHARFADREEELRAAAHWARGRLEASAGGRAAVIIPGLASLRGQVARIFDETFSPSLRFDSPRAPAFHVSAGAPLREVPIAAAAFDLLALGKPRFSLAEASLALRSPFCEGFESERGRRALLEAELRARALVELDTSTLARLAAREGTLYSSPLLARALHATAALTSARRQPSAWSHVFSDCLAALGWPGTRTLSSADYQAVEAWKKLLSSFASLDLVSTAMSYGRALGVLTRLASAIVFSPADPGAPVQVMGELEAIGASFDCAWIAGLDDRTWPAPPAPDAFIPPPVQRKLGMPHASAARELEYARRLCASLTACAPEIVVSAPRREDDAELRVSPLVADIEAVDWPAPPPNLAALTAAGPAAIESIDDRLAPPVASGTTQRGGTRVLKLQSGCPFRAFAEIRLLAEPLEEPAPGFDAQLRGIALHAALRIFWSETGSHAALIALTPEARGARIASCVELALDEALQDAGAARFTELRRLEQTRLASLLDAWLEVEALREPFTIEHLEHSLAVEAGGLKLNVRADRVDSLPSGAHVLIDYKSTAPWPSVWEGDRPEEPQLPLYACKDPAPVAAVLFAQAATGRNEFRGYSETPFLPGSKPFSETRIAAESGETLDAHIAGWWDTLERIARQFAGGHAAVDPRDSQTCRTCTLGALCRVAAAESEDETPVGASDDE